jgi:hypothetical protein
MNCMICERPKDICGCLYHCQLELHELKAQLKEAVEVITHYAEQFEGPFGHGHKAKQFLKKLKD